LNWDITIFSKLLTRLDSIVLNRRVEY
jgi:hypothetical protein